MSQFITISSSWLQTPPIYNKNNYIFDDYTIMGK